jgi:hypothetical protein
MTAVRRTKLKGVLAVLIERQEIERETKSRGYEAECGTKLSETKWSE